MNAALIISMAAAAAMLMLIRRRVLLNAGTGSQIPVDHMCMCFHMMSRGISESLLETKILLLIVTIAAGMNIFPAWDVGKEATAQHLMHWLEQRHDHRKGIYASVS